MPLPFPLIIPSWGVSHPLITDLHNIPPQSLQNLRLALLLLSFVGLLIGELLGFFGGFVKEVGGEFGG